MYCRWCWVEKTTKNTYLVNIKWKLYLRARCKLCYNNWNNSVRKGRNKLYLTYLKVLEENKEYLTYIKTYAWLVSEYSIFKKEISYDNVLLSLRKFNIKQLINKEAQLLYNNYKNNWWDLDKWYWIKEYKATWNTIKRWDKTYKLKLTTKEIELAKEYISFKKWWIYKTKSSYFEVVRWVMKKDIEAIVLKYNYYLKKIWHVPL